MLYTYNINKATREFSLKKILNNVTIFHNQCVTGPETIIYYDFQYRLNKENEFSVSRLVSRCHKGQTGQVRLVIVARHAM